MKRAVFIIALLLLTSCAPNEADFKSDVPTSPPTSPTTSPPTSPTTSPPTSPTTSPATEPPSEINLNVPFYPQAPDANWGMPWQEACEEASVILAYYYATGQDLTKEKFKEEVYKLVDWEIENYGSYEHTDISQTVRMLESNFEFSNFLILNDISVEDMKNELAEGNVIIAPFAGRELGNPFYSGEGPYYHMLVIKGYDEENFITNDVGTKRGENFIYPYRTIISAMHEWHDEDITLGAKKIIVVKPK
ncbi:C39 family peptidase [Patescibacteria group bacterium]|nr:C39 family peptidase [Patescibacteria group bacterium]